LELIDIAQAVVTVDAMSTQKEIVAKIRNRGGEPGYFASTCPVAVEAGRFLPRESAWQTDPRRLGPPHPRKHYP
jgi:hypothetical protein